LECWFKVGRTSKGHQRFIAHVQQDRAISKGNRYTFQTTVIAGDIYLKRNPAIIATTQQYYPIANVAKTHRGKRYTRQADRSGNNACAWSINASYNKPEFPFGRKSNYVASLVEALKSDRGQLIARRRRQGGDLK
jgi:hypothetical protein